MNAPMCITYFIWLRPPFMPTYPTVHECPPCGSLVGRHDRVDVILHDSVAHVMNMLNSE